MCEFIPDGIVVYFPNIAVFMRFISEKIGEILSDRPAFFEHPYCPKKTMESFKLYQQSCNVGGGALFFCVANGWARRNL